MISIVQLNPPRLEMAVTRRQLPWASPGTRSSTSSATQDITNPPFVSKRQRVLIVAAVCEFAIVPHEI
ncbi:hypothetical protein ElyMa_002800100 [Elysia marginata]|uniref:Uncharacterized protein n=1 Tax=Elysia marginata TaxID=1093978 RepID=A0AAV4HQW6_9GAST|nr:hypothetical protein ElyMa_002800100 [Elysia marginata]